MGHHDGYSGGDDHLYDYERENKTKRKFKNNRHQKEKADDDFFQFESSQRDVLVDHETDKMNWG